MEILTIRAMKKFFHSVLFVAALLAASSCAQELNNPESQKTFSPKVLTAYSDDATKTSLDGTSILWTDADAITAFGYDGQPYHSTATVVSDAGKKAQFTIDSMSSNDEVFLAIYPKDENATFDDNGYLVSTTLPTEQSIVANSFANGANLAIAEGTEEDYLKFRNVGGFLCMTVNNDNITSIKLSSNTVMTGDVIVDYNGGEPEAIPDEDGTTANYVELTGSFVNGTPYYFVVLPGTYSNLTVTFTRNDGKIAVMTNSNTLTVERNANLNIGTITIPESAWNAFAWDLATNQMTSSSETALVWNNGTVATMRVDKASATTASNNYCPPAYSSTRMYKNSTLSISPRLGYSINKIEFVATTNSYASALKNSSWTNATAEMESGSEVTLVTVTPTVGNLPISATVGANFGLTTVRIYYSIFEIIPVESVSVKASTTIQIGGNETLVATVLPANAYDKSVSWSSSDTDVATVSNTGVVTAVAVGQADITATTTDGGRKATCTVTVSPIAVTGISVKSSTIIAKGETETLVPVFSPSNATNKNVQWTSDNSEIASVNENGVVSAVAKGTATITATTVDGGFTASCEVSVVGTTVTLFSESFGNNTGTIRDWSDTYKAQGGISSVYSGASYTITNARQGKNTTGKIYSGINQTTSGTDASFVVGPLSVSTYTNLHLSYWWKAASVKNTYFTRIYYKTSSDGDYAEVPNSAEGATGFVQVSVDLPAAAISSTLYLKIVFNTSNTQAIIDEVVLTGSE